MKTNLRFFQKLNRKFFIDNYTIENFFRFYGNTVSGIQRGISYHTVKGDKLSDLLTIIPTKYLTDDNFSISLMSINTHYIPPHTDSNILSSINFYIKTDSCRTNFFSAKVGSLSTSQIENQTNGYIFKESELKNAGSFVAESGDAYLLDVSKPHSVIGSPKIEVDRKAIVIQSRKYDFNTVRLMLIETGYLRPDSDQL